MNIKRLIRYSLAILVIFLFFGGLRLYSNIEIKQGEALVPAIGKFITVDGVKLHYLEKGSGKPVILLHGINGILESFSPFFDKLAAKYRVIDFDRPGHGYSQKLQELNLGSQAEFFHNALSQMKIVKPVLVGHSYGGALVLKYAYLFPDDVSAIAALSPVAYDGKELEEYSSNPLVYIPKIPIIGKFFMDTLQLPLSQIFIKGLSKEKIYYPDVAPESYQEIARALSLRPRQFEAFLEELKNLGSDLETSGPRYKDIKTPVVIAVGDSDRLLDPEKHSYRLHQEISNSKLIVLKNTGHEFYIYHPEAVVEAVDAAWKLAVY